MDKDWTPGHATHEPEDLELVYARRPYRIKVGESKQVPFDIVRLYFGDPRAIPDEYLRYEDFDGQVGDIPPRQQEVRRLAGLYGLYDQNMHLLPQHPRISGIEITTVGTPDSPPQEIFTPALDPEGEVGIYGHTKPNEESHDIATLLSEARAGQDALARRVAELEAKAGEVHEDDEIGRDGPHRGS